MYSTSSFRVCLTSAATAFPSIMTGVKSDRYPPSLHAEFSLDKKLHCERVEDVLPPSIRAERLSTRVALPDLDGLLEDDRARVHLRDHEVHRAARRPSRRSQGLLLRVEPRERRKERRVDVEYPSSERRRRTPARAGA